MNNNNDKNCTDELVSRTRGLKVDTSWHDSVKTTTPSETSLTDVMHSFSDKTDISLFKSSSESLYVGGGDDRGGGNDNDDEDREEEEEAEAGVANETSRVRPLTGILNNCTPTSRRDKRSESDIAAIQCLGDSPICGGDYIANEFCGSATLSFAFEASGENKGRRFGLTCAHLLSGD